MNNDYSSSITSGKTPPNKSSLVNMTSSMFTDKEQSNLGQKYAVPMQFLLTNPLVHTLTKESFEIIEEKNKEKFKKSAVKDQTKSGRRTHYFTTNMGYNQTPRKTLRQKPEWMTILNETNMNGTEMLEDLDLEEVYDIFNNKDFVFRLTDKEMTQLKILLKDQLMLETDLQMGTITYSENIYSLVVNLALNNGDLSKLTDKEKALVLNLIQFINIVPSFDDDYLESVIELGLDNGNDFVEFKDIGGAEIFVRKSSFMKSQILEDKIMEELKEQNGRINRRSSLLLLFAILYMGVKVVLFVIGVTFSGNSEGFDTAMESATIPTYENITD